MASRQLLRCTYKLRRSLNTVNTGESRLRAEIGALARAPISARKRLSPVLTVLRDRLSL